MAIEKGKMTETHYFKGSGIRNERAGLTIERNPDGSVLAINLSCGELTLDGFKDMLSEFTALAHKL